MQNLWQERISSKSDVLAGKPVVAGMRISVELALDCLVGGWGHRRDSGGPPTYRTSGCVRHRGFFRRCAAAKPYITVSEVEVGE